LGAHQTSQVSQPPSGGTGGRSFAAALRNLAKQAIPSNGEYSFRDYILFFWSLTLRFCSERDAENSDSTRQVSPKRSGPPPLVRGSGQPSPGPVNSNNRQPSPHLNHDQRKVNYK